MDATHLLAGLARSSFPRSAAYDPVWLLDNMMGPCSVWLTEALALQVTLAPGSRVVDVGCGKAMSSIFLAREFGVQVTAVDCGSAHRTISSESTPPASPTWSDRCTPMRRAWNCRPPASMQL